jgi:glycosyltransferase involved in cell wall biosynthesis
MKILLVHNDYGKYSGEEAVVDKMAILFRSLGHDVAQLRMTTAGSRENLRGKARGFVSGIYCPQGVRAMREALRRERPDVVNVHNLYPFISPAALMECRRAGVPVVMTVHNFRLVCPTGLFMRNGIPCEVCLERGDEWGCIRYNCEGSMLKSLGYAARNAVARHGRYYLDGVTRFACITDFQRRKLVEAGFPQERIRVIPNSLDVEDGTPEADARNEYVAYCGRISREKGVDMILDVARRHPEVKFRMAGAVREADLVADLPGNVELVGYLAGEDLGRFYRGARFLVMASRWYEGFPMTILEAARYAKAMVAPDHGGFTEIIGRGDEAIGVLFRPGDAVELEKAVMRLWRDEALAGSLGQKALEKLKKRYASVVVAREWERLLTELVKKK